jgi:hypothetical protein
MGLQVDQVVADPHAWRVVADRHPAGDRPQASQQLVDVEGLGDVVVGAGVQGVDLRGALTAPGQDDDRGRGPATQPTDDVDAIHVGEPQVEHDDVRQRLGGRGKRLPAVGGGHDVVRAGGQVDTQGTQDLGFVVNDEHSRHGAAWLGDVGSDGAGGVVGVTQALEGSEHLVPVCGRDAGPVVDDVNLDPVAQGAGAEERRATGRAVSKGVGDEVGDDSFQEGGVGQAVGKVLGEPDDDVVAPGPEVVQGERDDLIERHRPDEHAERPCLQAAQVKQVLHQPDQPVQGLVGGGQQLVAVVRCPGDIAAAEAANRGLGRGERAAQVVADGGEQGGAHAVGLDRPLRLFGLLREVLVFQRRGRLRRERAQHPEVLWTGGGPGGGQGHGVADRHLHVGLAGRRRGALPGAA